MVRETKEIFGQKTSLNTSPIFDLLRSIAHTGIGTFIFFVKWTSLWSSPKEVKCSLSMQHIRVEKGHEEIKVTLDSRSQSSFLNGPV